MAKAEICVIIGTAIGTNQADPGDYPGGLEEGIVSRTLFMNIERIDCTGSLGQEKSCEGWAR